MLSYSTVSRDEELHNGTGDPSCDDRLDLRRVRNRSLEGVAEKVA